MTLADITAEEVREAVRAVYLFRYITVATGTILTYDYCSTFAQEVSLVWTSQWSTINILYMLTRYMPFFDTGLVLYHQFWTGLGTREVCLSAYRLDAFLFVFGIGISEIILMIRIWVIWEKDHRLALVLPALFATAWTGILVSMWYFLQSMQFFSIPIPEFSGCYSSSSNAMLILDWVVFMVFEIVMLGFMLVKGIRAYGLTRTMPLFRVVYRDGVLFYIYVVGISASNVIFIVSFPGVALLLTPLGRVMHSVLTVRFVLELRQELCKLNTQDDHSLTEIAFTQGSGEA